MTRLRSERMGMGNRILEGALERRTALSPFGALVVGLAGFAGSAARADGPCAVAACDVANGTGCRDDYEPAETIYALEVEAVDKTLGLVASCTGPWHGAGGCYATRIQARVSDSGLVQAEIADVDHRADTLPEAARQACDRRRPSLALSALDDVTSWCPAGQSECAGALDLARAVLRQMPDWSACVELMESRVKENARTVCTAPPTAPAPPPPPTFHSVAPTTPPAPAPVIAKPAPAKPPAPVVVRSGVVTPAPTSPVVASLIPTRKLRDEAGPVETTHGELATPKPVVERRAGQIELSLAPFSGLLTIRDPATSNEYQPLAASVALGVSGVASLSRSLDLEIALVGRGLFASTALQQSTTKAIDELDAESGTAFVIDVEPSIAILTKYVGFGIIGDFRWDSLGVTALTTGLTKSDAFAAMGGARLLFGFGLLATDYRLVGVLDYLFLGERDRTFRASLRAEIGPALITAAYTEYARLGATTDAYVQDHLQLTVGFRLGF